MIRTLIDHDTASHNPVPVIYMPNADPCKPPVPAPFLMTALEVGRFMRIPGKDPARTVKGMGRKGLVSRRLSKSERVYRLPDVIKFLSESEELV